MQYLSPGIIICDIVGCLQPTCGGLRDGACLGENTNNVERIRALTQAEEGKQLLQADVPLHYSGVLWDFGIFVSFTLVNEDGFQESLVFVLHTACGISMYTMMCFG
jgi:hypothetical protein